MPIVSSDGVRGRLMTLLGGYPADFKRCLKDLKRCLFRTELIAKTCRHPKRCRHVVTSHDVDQIVGCPKHYWFGRVSSPVDRKLCSGNQVEGHPC